MKKITYWGGKQEITLMVKGVPIYFKYGQSRIMDLPVGINLPKFFVIEDITEADRPKAEAQVVVARKKAKGR